MTSMTQDLDYLPPITCKPWCEAGDGHPGAWISEDQTCKGQERHVPLVLPVRIPGRPLDADPEYAQTYLTQQFFEGPTRVWIGLSETATGWLSTVKEARAFAAHLLALCDESGD